MWIRIRSPADSPLSYCSVLERVNSQKKSHDSQRFAKPIRSLKLFKTSVLPIRRKPIRCSSLQFVAVRIGSNQLFALRIALRIASQVTGWFVLEGSGDEQGIRKNWLELTRRNTVQIRLSLLVVLNRCYLRPGDTMQYNLHHKLERIATDCNVAQRWGETRFE